MEQSNQSEPPNQLSSPTNSTTQNASTSDQSSGQSTNPGASPIGQLTSLPIPNLTAEMMSKLDPPMVQLIQSLVNLATTRSGTDQRSEASKKPLNDVKIKKFSGRPADYPTFRSDLILHLTARQQNRYIVEDIRTPDIRTPTRRTTPKAAMRTVTRAMTRRCRRNSSAWRSRSVTKVSS